MKTKQMLAAAVVAVSLLALSLPSRAADITATGSGNWSSTVPDAPWPDGIVPGTNDSIDVESPFVISVDSTQTCAYIYGGGSVVMTAGSRLNVLGDSSGGFGTQTLGLLDATAPGNTVDYRGNAFWAKRTDYVNLIFSGAGDFYNGSIPGYSATPMTIAGDMTLSGTNISVQQGADISIGGNLSMLGATNKWDCSSFYLTVNSNTFVTGTRALLVDLDGGLGYNLFKGDVTVGSNALAWNVSDVVHWEVDGSLTNQGLIAGKGYGSILFGGQGVITGKAFKLPTLTIYGRYLIGTTITLATNTPTLVGTLVFDLATPTNRLILQSYPTNPLTLYYAANLEVINSGPAPTSGSTFTFFSATNYDGSFTSISLPTPPPGLNWVDNLLTSGSISLTGTPLGSPTLAYARTNNVLTLSWDSTTYPGYSVQAQTNSTGIRTNWSSTASGTVSPYVTTVNPGGPAVFYRLVK